MNRDIRNIKVKHLNKRDNISFREKSETCVNGP